MEANFSNKTDIITRFNDLRERYGELLIKLKRTKISENQWYEYIFREFSEEEISFIFGQNIWKFVNKKDAIIDLGKGTRVEIENNLSRLRVSPEKAGILTWICTDGYMSLHSGGHYISIKDDDILVFDYFKKLINHVYGNVNFQVSKVKDKNAFQCLFCSKDIFKDLVTYIPLSFSKNWTIPIEILDKEAKREVLKVLMHTEGSTYKPRRTRAVRLTLANFEVLIQTKYLLKEFEIETLDIKNHFHDGWVRYNFDINDRGNLEKFRKEIHFIPNTKKYDKFENIMKGYKEYHHPNNSCSGIILDTIKKNQLAMTKDITKISKLHYTSVWRNLKKLRQIGAVDYKKGIKNTKYWFTVYN